MTTALQMAKHDCANYIARDDSCIGVTPDGLIDSRIPLKPNTKCLLADRPMKPCLYFEQLILPLADNPSPKNDPGLQAERLKARQTYLAARKKEVPEAKARKCECGNLLAKRQRVCAECAKKQRQQSYRNSKRKMRQKQGLGVHS